MNGTSGRKPNVVVIDDEPDFLRLVESWLKPSFQVTCLPGAVGAAAKIRTLNPDLVLVDVHLADGSGFDLCRELRAQPEFADVPVVFLTGSKTDEDFLQHLESGGTRYLTKPISRKALLDSLAEQLGTRPA